MKPGTIIVLNGSPRSGKSSIALAMNTAGQSACESSGTEVINLGVDSTMAETPADRLPGIGLRPGGERPDLEDYVQQGYRTLFDTLADHARRGISVVSDLGIHDWYSRPLGIWSDAAARLAGLPVYLVGVRCSLEVILERRAAKPERYLAAEGDHIPEPVLRWERAVHDPGWYDLEVDTSSEDPGACAAAIAAHIAAHSAAHSALSGPRALARHLDR